jgi:CRP-like cAMP-binding protein
LRRIASITDEVRLPQGKTLTRQGAVGREFFIVLEGTVDVEQNGRKVNTLGPGDFFGEIALLTKRPRSATVTAASPLETLVMTGRDFRALLREAPAIQAKVLEVLAARLAPDSL